MLLTTSLLFGIQWHIHNRRNINVRAPHDLVRKSSICRKRKRKRNLILNRWEAVKILIPPTFLVAPNVIVWSIGAFGLGACIFSILLMLFQSPDKITLIINIYKAVLLGGDWDSYIRWLWYPSYVEHVPISLILCKVVFGLVLYIMIWLRMFATSNKVRSHKASIKLIKLVRKAI